jgi:hypothetical protein
VMNSQYWVKVNLMRWQTCSIQIRCCEKSWKGFEPS